MVPILVVLTTTFIFNVGVLYYKWGGEAYLPADSKLKQLILQEFQASPTASHGGVKRTLVRISTNFYWKGLQRDIKNFVSECDVCQKIKLGVYSPSKQSTSIYVYPQKCGKQWRWIFQ